MEQLSGRVEATVVLVGAVHMQVMTQVTWFRWVSQISLVFRQPGLP